MSTYHISRSNAVKKSKHGINLWIYDQIAPELEVVYVESADGHLEEFYHKTSRFTYYVIDGKGEFYFDGKPTQVKAGDVVTAKPGTKIYYLGKMKLLLITTPAYKAEDEVHVRDIEEK
jgi:mannose-6-phosphate isomerase-like protein (cupin superfamily)